jgi:hypothetical protein
MEKQCASSMLPEIIVPNSFINANYFNSQCYKVFLDANVDHSQMSRLQTNDGSKATT